MNTTSKVRRISEERPWMKYYSEDLANAPTPQCTAYSYLRQMNEGRMDATAINYYGKKFTYKELIDNIEICASAFTALGVKAGDTVSFLSVAVPETITAIYALNKLGATANTIDPRMDIASIERMVNESGSSVLIAIDVAFPKVQAIMRKIRQKYIIVQPASRSLPPVKKLVKNITSRAKIPYSDKIIRWDDFLPKGNGITSPEANYRGDATVGIAYTGGTTGFPKGVMLTNDSINAVAYNFQHAGLAAVPGDKFLGIIPVFSSYGFVCGMHMPLCMGFELCPIPRFVPDSIGKLVKEFRPNHMIATPAFYEILMNSKEMKGFDLSFLITMGSGGDTMNEGLEDKLKAFMKSHNIRYPLAQGYGMSELSAAASFCVNDIYKPASVGIPSVTTTIAIFDPDTGEELSYGQLGEICITGPSMMKGYYRHEDATAHVMRLHSDGKMWIHSGDLGYMDEDGFLFIKGRVKRMITRFDGHKVFPVNLESLVAEHPAVRNCSVIGIRDRGHGQGQYPLVLAELPNVADKEALCYEIFDICNTRSEERGRPVAVLPIDAIPLTGSMKNDYRILEKQYADFDYVAWEAKRSQRKH